jgi:hypothetical protein
MRGSKSEYGTDRSPFAREEEYIQLKSELKEVYLELSVLYKKMSKTCDDWFLNGKQSTADSAIKKTLEIREKIQAFQKKWFVDFAESIKDQPIHPY